MPQNICDRRTFLRATATAFAAGRFDIMHSYQQPLREVSDIADDQLCWSSVSSSPARPNAGRYRPKFNSKSLGRP
jgi:hypothetical protein